MEDGGERSTAPGLRYLWKSSDLVSEEEEKGLFMVNEEEEERQIETEREWGIEEME